MEDDVLSNADWRKIAWIARTTQSARQPWLTPSKPLRRLRLVATTDSSSMAFPRVWPNGIQGSSNHFGVPGKNMEYEVRRSPLVTSPLLGMKKHGGHSGRQFFDRVLALQQLGGDNPPVEN
jgi:hypothetical protein